MGLGLEPKGSHPVKWVQRIGDGKTTPPAPLSGAEKKAARQIKKSARKRRKK